MAALHADRRLRLSLFEIYVEFNFFSNFIGDCDIGHFLATFKSDYFKAIIMRFTRTRNCNLGHFNFFDQLAWLIEKVEN